LRKVNRWESPGELLQPIAAAAADLICHQDFRLIRACAGSGCTLLFLDRTKAHARRWCSMAVCGNRAKAAAHRARRARNDGGET
jgi:predicted RNA-binding Zn ribbon-like protein